MENLLWILGRIKPYAPFLLIALIGSIIQSASATGVALLVKGIIDNVFILKDKESLFKTVSFLLVLAFTMQGGFFISRYFVVLASEKTLRDIREEIFSKLVRVNYKFFVKHPAGDLISRTVSDVEKTRQILVDQIPVLLREPFVALALFGALLYRDPFLTLALIVVLPVMSFMVRFFGSKKGKHLKRVQESTAGLTQVLSQTFQGIENVKVFSAELKVLEGFKKFNALIYKSAVKSEFYIAGNTVLNYLLGYVVTAGVIFYGGFRIVSGHLSPGDFISYLTALFMIQPPLINSQKALMNLRGSLPVVGRIRELLSLEEEDKGKEPFRGFSRIIFREVGVSVNGKRILRSVNLTIKKGEKIGIVGRTGSGKSTLVRIIPKLVDYEGTVTFDSTELRDIDTVSLRSKIGFTTQEVFLLNASVRENLLIAKGDASEEEIRRALELAECGFVYRLEKGLDTVVGERGHSLSGGERQRIALARIFLRNPDIVILDEATSALDMETEKKVMENIFTFFKDKTLLIVAHRLSNIKECDRIIVMKEGTIVEEGTYEELLEKRGEFYRIFKEGTLA